MKKYRSHRVLLVLSTLFLIHLMALQGLGVDLAPDKVETVQRPAVGLNGTGWSIAAGDSETTLPKALWSGGVLTASDLTLDGPYGLNRPERLFSKGGGKVNGFTLGLMSAAGSAATGNNPGAPSQALNAGIDFILPALHDYGPDWLKHWLKRVEVEFHLRDNLKPEFSILTVQPLFESKDLVNTVFTQLSQRRYWMLNKHRNVSNIGLGYRRLFLDDTLLAGANIFFDNEWTNYHNRGSLGAEIRWFGVDLYFNAYRHLSGNREVEASKFERALDGYDIEWTVQAPYLPWLRGRGKRFEWSTVDVAENVGGWTVGFEADLHQNLQIEYKAVDASNQSSWEHAVFIRFRYNFPQRAVAMSSRFVDSKPWEMRDMKHYRLDKVRRENKIILENTVSGSVTVGRGT